MSGINKQIRALDRAKFTKRSFTQTNCQLTSSTDSNNHWFTTITGSKCPLQGKKCQSILNQSNERAVHSNSNQFREILPLLNLYTSSELPTYFRLLSSWLLWRAKWFWSRKNALFIGLHWRQCTLFGTGFSCRFQKLILRRVFFLVSESCTAHLQRHRSRAINEWKPRTATSKRCRSRARLKAPQLTCKAESAPKPHVHCPQDK